MSAKPNEIQVRNRKPPGAQSKLNEGQTSSTFKLLQLPCVLPVPLSYTQLPGGLDEGVFTGAAHLEISLSFTLSGYYDTHSNPSEPSTELISHVDKHLQGAD